MPLETPDVQLDVTDGVDTTHPAMVILFNDEVHTFDDVATQLVKAIRCSLQRGYDFANEVHTRGKACVYTGEMPECLRVSGVLEEIALHTQIEM
jgi:ATP-dependent Clp protease adapter protein ClpS